MSWTFVGREPELAALAAALDRVREGLGQLIAVRGEPGIGKTTLVERFCATASPVGVLWGSCWDGIGEPTYWPWVQVLRGAAGAGGDEVVNRLADRLAPLGLHGSPPSGTGTMVERFALFDAVTQLLHAIAAARPLVVVLENLHAGGPANALLLEFVARHSRHVPLLLIATYREVDARLDEDLARVLPSLEAVATTITVRAFTRSDVRDLAAAVLRDPTERLVAEVLGRTQGNPLFVTQVLDHLNRRDDGATERAGEPVPAALRLAIRRRADRVADAAGVPRFLDVAAVLGDQVDVAVVAAVLDHPASAVASAADLAVDAGIMRPAGPDYAFVHALMREAIYGDLRPAVRRDWHLAVAHELAARDAHPALVAHHFLAAWPAGGADEAAVQCLRAGERAMRSLAAEDAVGHYRSALTALARSPHDRRRDRCTTRLALGAALIASGRLDSVRSEAGEAMALAEQLDDAELTSRAALLGSEHLEFNAVDHEAIAMLRRADAAWGETASGWRARVLARLAVATATSDRPGADAAAAQAEAVALRAGDAGALATALSARLHADWGRHEPDTALRAARRIQDLVPESVDGHLWCAVFALERGLLDLAAAAVAEVTRLGADQRRPTISHLALSRRSTLAAVRGDLSLALDLATQAWQLGARCGLPDADAVYWGQLFAVWRGDALDDQRTEQMESIVSGLVEHSPLRMVHESALVQILHADGRVEQARRRYDGLLTLVPSLAHDMVRVFSLVLMAENCVLFDDIGSARMLHDALAPYADRWAVAAGAVACLGPVREPLARLAALLTPASSDAPIDPPSDAPIDPPSDAPIDAAVPDAGARVRLDRQGAVWRVSAGKVLIHLPDRRGMGYLAQLLDRPGRDITALALFAGPGDASPSAAVPAGAQMSTGADAVLDTTAKAAYHRRIRELNEEIDQAQSWHDPERLVRLRDERDALVHEITAAFGLGGRPRRLGSEAERARLNVTRAIRSAIRDIAAQAPELGAHLDAAVSTGARCRYDPPD